MLVRKKQPTVQSTKMELRPKSIPVKLISVRTAACSGSIRTTKSPKRHQINSLYKTPNKGTKAGSTLIFIAFSFDPKKLQHPQFHSLWRIKKAAPARKTCTDINSQRSIKFLEFLTITKMPNRSFSWPVKGIILAKGVGRHNSATPKPFTEGNTDTKTIATDIFRPR